MGWKSVAWVGCLVPVLAGCGSLPHAAHNATNEVHLSHTQRGLERDLRSAARDSWQTVRALHPRRTFTDEFHDGFTDGFTDYLDRGGAVQPPAVPPIKYVRDKKYFTPEGHSLIRDYYLGFKYGTDCAVASGRRQFLTVPVLLPDGTPTAIKPSYTSPIKPSYTSPIAPRVPVVLTTPPTGTKPLPAPLPRPANSDTWNGANTFEPKSVGTDPLKPPTDEPTRPISSLPKPEMPVIKPFNPVLPSGDTKFTPLPVPPDPDRLPVPDPPLPIPVVPLPEPLASVPTPSILDPMPTIPFKFAPVPVTPTSALIPRK